jgi:hypothetical protein
MTSYRYIMKLYFKTDQLILIYCNCNKCGYRFPIKIVEVYLFEDGGSRLNFLIHDEVHVSIFKLMCETSPLILFGRRCDAFFKKNPDTGNEPTTSIPV